MRIAVFGTGMVGQAIAARCDELGHDVTVGTRDVAASRARMAADGAIEGSFGAWLDAHPAITLATYADAAAASELVVNATSGQVALAALGAAGSEHLAGKILIDISNPLDFSAGFPPTLFIKDTDSLGEQIQAAFPDTHVVKTLNTLAAELMVRPAQLAGGQHSVFMSGNDADAKATVRTLLEEFGHTDIIDLGDISTCRGTEMLLALWVRAMGALGTEMFNIKVVR